MPGLMFNDDEVNFFLTVGADGASGQAVDEHVDAIADAGVTCLLCNTNGMRTNYDSQVWEPYWKDYDPDGGDGQAVLRDCPPDTAREVRPIIDAMLSLHRQGVDFPARVIERCRTRGVSPWITLRMNDAHETLGPTSPFQSTFWKENPHLRRVPHSVGTRPDQALDFAHGDVRDHYLKLVRETLERYDIDGLELDFMRHQFYFGVGRELAGGTLLSAWLAEIRNLVDEARSRRAHPVQLGVRVPSRPNTARRIGLNVATWARKGLIDLVTVAGTAYATTTEFDIPMRLWHDLLSPYGVKLAGSVEPNTHRYAGVSQEWITPETAAGAATAMLNGGADTICLFNWFYRRLEERFTDAGWTRPSFETVLHAMHSLKALQALPRRHVVTYREVLAPGELVPVNPMVLATRLGGSHVWSELRPVEYPLPALGLHLAFRLQTGPRPTGRKVQVVVGLEADTDATVYAPMVRVNSVECARSETTSADGAGAYTYDVLEDAFADEEHVIEVTGNTATGGFLKVTRVEFWVGAIGNRVTG